MQFLVFWRKEDWNSEFECIKKAYLTAQSHAEDHEEEEDGPDGRGRQFGEGGRVRHEDQSRTWKTRTRHNYFTGRDRLGSGFRTWDASW